MTLPIKTSTMDAINLERDQLIAKYLPDFTSWFIDIIEEMKPDYIISIARGATRLLNITRHQWKDKFKGVFLSDRALPFLENQQFVNKKFLIFDDSIIVGSTMDSIRTYLLIKGALVYCVTYMVDELFYKYTDGRQSDYAIKIPLRSKLKRKSSDLKIHHDSLVRVLLSTPKPYNLDFPTFSIKTSDSIDGNIDYLINIINKNNYFRIISDISSSISAAYGIFRFSGLPLKLKHVDTMGNNLIFRNFIKFRITLLERLNEIRITPIIHFCLKNGAKYDDILFNNNILSDNWAKLVSPTEKDPPDFYFPALYRLLTYFISTILFVDCFKSFENYLNSQFHIDDVRLTRPDPISVLGTKNTEILNSFFIQIINEDITNMLSDSSFIDNQINDCSDNNLFEQLIKLWSTKIEYKPTENENLSESLSKIFLSIRSIKDETNIHTPKIDRLRVGISYNSILKILEPIRDNFDFDTLSFVLDSLVDSGQAVPKILLCDDCWMRTFTFGENDNGNPFQQFKLQLHTAYFNYLKLNPKKYLNLFQFYKICVILRDLINTLPFSTKFDTYGRTPCIDRDEREFIKILTYSDSGIVDVIKQGNSHVVVPRSNLFYPIKSTWAINDEMLLFQYFNSLATLSHEITDESLILLSTCKTIAHTYNSIAHEIHSFIRNKYNNVDNILSLVHSFCIKNEKSQITNLYNNLYWCIIFLSEADKKYNVFFKEYNLLLDDIRRVSDILTPNDNHLIMSFISNKDFLNLSQEDEVLLSKTNYIYSLLYQIERLMSIIFYTIESIFKLFKMDDFIDYVSKKHYISLKSNKYSWFKIRDVKKACDEFNEFINKSPLYSLLKNKNEITIWNSEKDIIPSEFLNEIHNALSDIITIVDYIFPKYNVTEGEMTYYPKSHKRILTDGTCEIELKNCFILGFDIIKSTDNMPATEFKDVIIQFFDKISDSNCVYYETTGNDAFFIVSEDTKLLFNIAYNIMCEGNRLSDDRMKGTRKAIYYGNLLVRKLLDNRIIIRDNLPPHSLPKIFSMVEGLKKISDITENKKNEYLIIPSWDINKIKELFTINDSLFKKVMIDEKHFPMSVAYAINLVELYDYLGQNKA